MVKNKFICDCDVIHTDSVKKVAKEMLPEEDFDIVVNFFKAIGDRTRFRILWALSKEELCVCDLANLLNMTKSAISHQLSKLRKTNLVSFRRDGKTIYYTLSDDHVREMINNGILHLHK